MFRLDRMISSATSTSCECSLILDGLNEMSGDER